MSSSTPSGSLSFAASAVLGAFLASACCVGPLLLALFGLGGAGLFRSLAPYRPLFLLAALALLGLGFFRAYQPRASDVCGCNSTPNNRSQKLLLLLAAVLVIGLLLFPYFESYLIA
jgi:mercuric ion transport protein